MIDAHCHLDLFGDELTRVAKNARAAGVLGAVSAGVWPQETSIFLSKFLEKYGSSELVAFRKSSFEKDWTQIKSLETGFGFFLTAGLHPSQCCERWFSDNGDFDEKIYYQDTIFFRSFVAKNIDALWAIGESGFDLSRDTLSNRKVANKSKDEILDVQRLAANLCAEISVEYGLPLIVHSRSAWAITRDYLFKVLRSQVRPSVMLHCCGSSKEELRALPCKGLFASFGGVITRPEATKMRGVVSDCAESQIVLETDAPFLPPVGVFPARNEPANLVRICEEAAHLRSTSSRSLAMLSDNNLFSFLGIESCQL